MPEGCDWVSDHAGALQLPDFPEFGPFDFTLPQVIPIPRLLPHLQLWEPAHGWGQLTSTGGEAIPIRTSHATAGQQQQAFMTAGAAAVLTTGGVLVGMVSALGLLRRVAGRGRLALRPVCDNGM